jgi:hypothetical protein
MPNRMWANTDWEVADDGLASLGTVDYFIARHRLCELRPGRQKEGVASWPLQMADKSWVRIETFLEAYQKALELLTPKGLEAVNLPLSLEMARELAFKTEMRRR